MKVQPTQNGDAAAPRIADTRIDNAESSAFKAVLAQASTGTTPGTDVAADPAITLRKGEKMDGGRRSRVRGDHRAASAAACSSTRAATSATAKRSCSCARTARSTTSTGAARTVSWSASTCRRRPTSPDRHRRRRRDATRRREHRGPAPAQGREDRAGRGPRLRGDHLPARAAACSSTRAATRATATHSCWCTSTASSTTSTAAARTARSSRSSPATTTTTTGRVAPRRAEARRRQLGRDRHRAVQHTVRHEPRRPRPEADSPRAVAGDQVQALDARDRTRAAAGRRPTAAGRTRARARSPRRAARAGSSTPRSSSCGAIAAASGSSGVNVDPTADAPSTVTTLNSDAGPPPGSVSDSTPACSTVCRGGAARRTCATTPHSATTGRHCGRGADRGTRPRAGGDHHRGRRFQPPAGANAFDAPVAAREHRRLAFDDTGPRGARPLGPGARGGGRRHRAAGGEPVAADAGREARLGGVERRALEPLGSERREARLHRSEIGGQRRRVVGHDEDAGRLGRQGEAVAEPGVQLERRLVERLEHRVHRMLDDAGVAARRAGRDRLALVQRHRGARLGQERGGGAARDAAADDGDDGRHPPTTSAPSRRRSLTWSCSGENGAARRSSAPAEAASRLVPCP